MKNTSKLMILLGLASFLSCTQNNTQDWQMAEAPLMTRWSADVHPETPWNHYPRPYLKRDNWINLNGLWNYSITGTDTESPDSVFGSILVPYPIESALSGVNRRVDKDDLLWYTRSVKIPAIRDNERLVMHFEAVDWKTRIWINNQFVGEHMGGYSPFSFDISDFVDAGKNADIRISVWDPSTEGTQAVGKQNTNPHGIWYTPSSGIWQTVWLEKVPESHITDYLAITDIDNSLVKLSTTVANPKDGDQITYRISLNGEMIAEAKSNLNDEASIAIPDMKLWSPDEPVLYDLEVSLLREEEAVDQISGYFGMRKISLGKDDKGITRIFLNNEFVFQNGPLDQGFWPDGLYTPPTEEAMLYDLEMLRQMGFNMLRKHVKVENRRFYYWTDKMGFLVWQDMPNGFFGRPVHEIQTDSEHAQQFESELKELVFSLDNHPSIIMWVPFNEGWGQYDTERIVNYVAELDPTRLINNASGWTDKGVGHVLDIHHYPEPIAPPTEENRAIVLGEFGGLGLPVQGHTWQQDKNWGYENMEGAESLLKKYELFYQEVRRLVNEEGLSAVVYTQTTDVEIETNGLLSYDREIDKMGVENLRKAHLGYTPPAVASTITDFVDSYEIILTATMPGAQIHYTLDGSEPQRSSELYTKGIVINETTTLKAISLWKNGEKSRTAEYTFNKLQPIPSVKEPADKGLSYTLYEGAWEKIPDFSEMTPIARGKASGINLDPAGSRKEDFGLVFEGHVFFPETAVYRFVVSSDDGGRLFVNNEMLIDDDGIHGMREKSATLALEKGYHHIEFHYFQHVGGLGLKVSWEKGK